MQQTFEWMHRFNELVDRQKHDWVKWERELANRLQVVSFSTRIATLVNQTEEECSWDAYHAEYEALLPIMEATIPEGNQSSYDHSMVFTLALVLLPAFHIVAWKCRWPRLRRRALDLLSRMPKWEWVYQTVQYHSIFSRIMEFEEKHLGLPPGDCPEEDWLPPEHERIQHFVISSRHASSARPMMYEVTFISRPHDVNGKIKCHSEMWELDSADAMKGALPINMMHPLSRLPLRP
ncbi:hypothetical protein N7462_009491 [Penicillium macrosclerotiorum]|uniref:uncharacterized protein n=1 Tax=Penicillium macrosclerotiorum TaxID=303699 RepID=UPI0025494442|nr:uncharacterized protein N7462_009491 [Penicillium macrosclerotiorum]KAJ5674052.1 hypothetical protein N7462_009491 [Penicillium macrosclerotiorum]